MALALSHHFAQDRAGNLSAGVAYSFDTIAVSFTPGRLYLFAIFSSQTVAPSQPTFDHNLDDLTVLGSYTHFAHARNVAVVVARMDGAGPVGVSEMNVTFDQDTTRAALVITEVTGAYNAAPISGTPTETSAAAASALSINLEERRLHSSQNASFGAFTHDERTGNTIVGTGSGQTELHNGAISGEEQRYLTCYRIGENTNTSTISASSGNNANWVGIGFEILENLNADSQYSGTALYPSGSVGEGRSNLTDNDALISTVPAGGGTASVAFSTTTTERYILCKPGAFTNTTPNQTTSPAAIAAQGFGYDVLRRFISNHPGLGLVTPFHKRYIKAQTVTVVINLIGTVTDLTSAYGFVANFYKRHTDGTYTYLAAVESALEPLSSINQVFDGSVSFPDTEFSWGETLHMELWIRGRGVAITGQTVTFNIGQVDPSRISFGTLGIRTHVEDTRSGSITPTSTLIRLPRKLTTGSSTPTSTLFRSKVSLRSLAGAIVPAAVVVKRACRFFLGSIDPSGIVLREFGRTTAGEITPTSTIDLLVQKVLTGSITPSSTLNRLLHFLFTGQVTPSGALIKEPAKRGLAGSVTPSGSPFVSAGKVLSGVITPISTVIRRTFKILTGLIEPFGDPSLTLRGIFLGSTTPTGALIKEPHVVGLGAEIGPVGDVGGGGSAPIFYGYVIRLDASGNDVYFRPDQMLRMTRNADFSYIVEFRDANNDPVDITGFDITITFRRTMYAEDAFFTLTTPTQIEIADQADYPGRAAVNIDSSHTTALPNQQVILYWNTDIAAPNDSVVSPIVPQRLIVDPDV